MARVLKGSHSLSAFIR